MKAYYVINVKKYLYFPNWRKEQNSIKFWIFVVALARELTSESLDVQFPESFVFLIASSLAPH